ncbi:hypothetical protein REPUB_Repub08aG0121200 [Reevesia pubescens]
MHQCMRMAHLGLSAHFIFNMTIPPITSKDLPIASAGLGGFFTIDAIARGVCTGIDMANDMEDDGSGGGIGEKSRTLLRMGSVYEGAMFVLFEMVVFKLGEVLGESLEAIRARHTNLE